MVEKLVALALLIFFLIVLYKFIFDSIKIKNRKANLVEKTVNRNGDNLEVIAKFKGHNIEGQSEKVNIIAEFRVDFIINSGPFSMGYTPYILDKKEKEISISQGEEVEVIFCHELENTNNDISSVKVYCEDEAN